MTSCHVLVPQISVRVTATKSFGICTRHFAKAPIAADAADSSIVDTCALS